jgi:peptidoglycan/xylan/chitin deacetylase (PgdA/CDA1 family)
MTSPVDRLADDGRLTIFLFHGVVETCPYEVRNYSRKHLPATEFRQILEALGRRGQALSMDDVVRICRSGDAFPSGAFAVTFDDGFENNLLVARPILDDLGIPATVYVTSRFVDENAMSWIDRIEWAIERVAAGSVRLPWSLEAVEFNGKDAKIELLNEIRRIAKLDRDLDLDDLVSSIFRQFDLDEVRASDDPLDRKMTWEQVRAWRAPGFIVGGHSHTHAVLSFLSPDALDREIDTSLQLLRDKAGIRTSHYSYPEGLAHCYSPSVISALKARGVTCSPTAIDGTNPPGADLFQLRRVMVS